MKQRIKNMLSEMDIAEITRYVIAGVGTTLVNLVVFALCRYAVGITLTKSNVISIFCAILFAFFVNKFYAFKAGKSSISRAVMEFILFVGARLGTMIVEVGGVYILAIWMQLNEMVSKILIQVIVVVVNYLFSKMLIFNHKKKMSITQWLRAYFEYVLVFVLSAAMFIGICIYRKVTPFGDQTLMIIDSLHQYLPFFSEYYDKLKKSGEFLYSWNGAMGYNFLTLWAYYLSSPFNLLILLFKKSHINTAMTLIIGLKICISSVTMAYMLLHMFQGNEQVRGKKEKELFSEELYRKLTAVMLGLCYAFSNYVIGYYWNIMWLDVLLLTPLVVLGLHYLIEKKDSRLYITTLFMALFCNFYISFMLCLFLVLWFLLYPHKNVKAFFASGFRFAGSSILAAAMAAFVLVPTYFGIMLTGPADSAFPEFSWYGNIIEILKKFAIYSGSITNQSDDGGVNLYCGMLTIMLVFLYYCVKEISIWQKIKKTLLIAFFLISFNNTVLNYIWHGFHDQFGIPNRFSFLLIFVLLIMSYETLLHIQKISFWSYFVPMILLIAVIIYNNVGTSLFSDINVIRLIMFTFIAYYLIFMMRIMLEWKPATLAIVLLICVTAELSYNAAFSFKGNGQITISDYFADTPRMTKAIQSVGDKSLYREELSKNKLVDENFWYNLKSVGIFGSTANGDAVNILGKMGFYTAANEHLYNGATPLTDSLLGVKYLYMRQGDYFDHGFDLYKSVDEVSIYKNPYALSMGYRVNDDIKDWDYEQYQPAEVLNDFVKKAAGVEGTLFQELPDDFEGSGQNCDVSSNETGDGTYAYKRTVDGDLTVSLTITPKNDEPIYIRATGTDLSGIQIAVNDVITADGRYFFQLVPVGNTKAGDKVTIKYTFTGSEADDQTVNLKAYTFSNDVFQQVYDILQKQQLEITSYTSRKIQGTIDMQEDGMMMTSIINEPGWNVYVDGKKQKITEIGDSFIGVNLSAGEHDVKICFVPKTFPIAALVSAIAWVIFFVYLKFRKRWMEGREQKPEVV